MNRTRKLMTAVAASLLLSGTLPAGGAAPSLQGQTANQPDESWKTDPKVGEAADTIIGWLKTTATWDDKAKSQNDIEKMFPSLAPALVANALQRLRWENPGVRRTGDGTESSPFRYWYCPQSTCG
jgi:hypothetical protein